MNEKVKLKKTEYLGKATNRFSANEVMKLHLQWVNLSDVADVCLRIEIVSMEGIALGTYTIYHFYCGQKDSVADAIFELDISEFMDSTYKMRYTFFHKNSAGSNQDIGYADGLCFEKNTDDSTIKLQWNVNNWGHIHLPNPKVISVQDS